jgi:hypothetical protein
MVVNRPRVPFGGRRPRLGTGQRLASVINSARILFKWIVCSEHRGYSPECALGRREHHQCRKRGVIESQSGGELEWFTAAQLIGSSNRSSIRMCLSRR